MLALMEMVTQGVSTSKVSIITEGLCGASFLQIHSQRTVCRAGRAGARVRRTTWMGDHPFILADAQFIKSREDDRVIHRIAPIVSGIRTNGHREIHGVETGDPGNFVTWDETFR